MSSGDEFRQAHKAGLVGPLPKHQGMWAECVQGWNPWVGPNDPQCAHCGVYAGHHWSCHEFPLELLDVHSGLTWELTKALELNAQRLAHPDKRIRAMGRVLAPSFSKTDIPAREPTSVNPDAAIVTKGVDFGKEHSETVCVEYVFDNGEYVMVTR